MFVKTTEHNYDKKLGASNPTQVKKHDLRNKLADKP
jgi:hypothetical protein